jgi:hypothetical protein
MYNTSLIRERKAKRNTRASDAVGWGEVLKYVCVIVLYILHQLLPMRDAKLVAPEAAITWNLHIHV